MQSTQRPTPLPGSVPESDCFLPPTYYNAICVGVGVCVGVYNFEVIPARAST